MAASEALQGGGSRRPSAHKLNYEAFLHRYDGMSAEWVRGEVRIVPPASRGHQHLAGFLYIVVGFWVRHYDLGEVLQPPFQMKLAPPINTGREPDLIFIRREHLDRLRETYLDGPADLVVEIISPESSSRDRGEKLAEYEQAGVPEYWLLDRDQRRAEYYELGSDGHYHLALSGSTGDYQSRVLDGFQLPLEWLWEDPVPAQLAALRELGLLT